MQIKLMRRRNNGQVAWMVSVRPRNVQSLIVLPREFKTPWGALWASRAYWRADDA